VTYKWPNWLRAHTNNPIAHFTFLAL